MPATAVLRLGERIRAERARQGVTLRALARSVGLSPSLISQIETGRCRPSVSTLYAITSALGISIEDVFGEGGAGRPGEGGAGRPGDGGADPPGGAGPGVQRPAEAAGPAGPPEAADAGPPESPQPEPAVDPPRVQAPADPVVRPGQREVLDLDCGVTWERLGAGPAGGADFLLVTYTPGGRSSPAGRAMRHAGTERGYLLAGELTVTVGDREHRMTAGDAISFRSPTPHSYRNEGVVPAVGVWFIAGNDGVAEGTGDGLSFSIS